MSWFEEAGDIDTRVAAVLVVIGSLSVVFGVVVVGAPEWAGETAGYAFHSPTGTVEFMVVYGGFYFGLGVFWLSAVWISGIREGAVAALALGSAGAALVRGAGVLFWEATSLQTLGLFFFEVAFAGLGFWVWKVVRIREDGEPNRG